MQRFLLLFTFGAALFLGGCKTPKATADKPEVEKKKESEWVHPNDGGDTEFRSFVGKLRKAAAEKDVRSLSRLMTEDFGYSWEPGSDGYGCFKYWDDNNVWPELQRVVGSQFLPNGGYLTAPPEFHDDPAYAGFRAGVRKDQGVYKFAYFVPAQNVKMAAPPKPGN